ncbi:hypothetical protein QOZ80_5AG0406650 [Eleusine coracana subsp. coracana]|nr:hypothetical protein QOZ80_5AG0406650 [Eleusine coracana subsp. coracana]
MPPPPPDRRDYLYREGRRHDGGGGGDPLPPPAPTPPRWRDSPYHPPPPLRDHARPSPRRAPSSVSSEGYYRQGGGAYDRSYPDEMPLGYAPSRSDRYWMDDEGGGYKGFSRYGGGSGGRRDGRDMRGSYRRSPFRSYGSDFSRNHQEPPPPPPPRRSPLRSVAVPICYDSPGNRVDRGDRENLPRVTPWRRRESRSEAAGAAGSGHGSSGQSTRSAASEKEVSAHPPPVTSPHGSEEEAPRKKARLGWGQGLAKYEKQKVQGPTDLAEADVSSSGAGQKASGAGQKAVFSAPAPAVCTSPVAVLPPPPAVCPSPVAVLPPPPAVCPSPVAVPPPAPALCSSTVGVPPPAPALSASPVAVPSPPSVRCASPVAVPSPAPVPPRCASPVAVPSPSPILPRCASPVALPSPAPGPEDKSCELTAKTVLNSTQDAPGADDQACHNEFPVKMDQLGDDPIGSLGNFLAKFLQHDSCSGDSKDPTSTSKLLVLKESISKEIEKTELEIDSLEGELKSVNTEAGTPLEDSPTGVTFAENASPSTAASKVPGNANICDKSHVKESRELSSCPKISVVQGANAKDTEMMEVETAPVQNAKTASSEESASCPGVAEGQACAAADVGPLKTSGQAKPQIDVDNERLEASSCHVGTDSVKPDGRVDLPGRRCLYPNHENNLSSFTSSNNDIAKVANELVFKCLPADAPRLDLLASSNVSIHRKNDSVIKERLVIHKNRVRFKEQALTFKFRALRYLWKEDVRLLCARKQRSKSNKRIDQSSRTSHIGTQRQRSTNRSRQAIPAGNSSTSLTPEISDVANKLFSGFQIKHCRNYLKMPALIIDEKEKECSRFASKNGLVEDPVAVEKERVLINPWAQEEKEIFMEMLAKFGKNFSKISSFLAHKTTADCVEFYYKHHKSDSFREVKKLLDQRQQQPTSNFLGAKSGKKWNREANAASLDIHGAASAVAAQGLEYEKKVEKIPTKSLIRNGSNVSFVARKSCTECLDNVSLHERESVAADVLAGICGTLSPEGMSSCVTSSADPGQKISITRMERVLTPEIDKSVHEEDTLSDQECEVDPVDWNDDEKSIFIEAMNNYGKDFARISSCVKSKSYEQCKVFFSKARKSLGLDLINQGAADVSMPTSDANGERSDTDEACAAEMDSAICSMQSFAKTEMDVCPTERAIQEPNTCIISKQTEGDGLNDCDVLDVKMEEGENKADETCSLDNHKCSEETHRSISGPIDINCPETTEKLEGTDDTTVDQMNIHGSSAISSSVEQAVFVQSETRMNGCLHHALDNAVVKAGNSVPSATIAADNGIEENVLLPKMTAASSIGPASTSSYQHMTGDKPPSKTKPQVTPLTPKDLMPVQFASVLPDPTSIRFEGIASITTPNFEGTGNRACNALEAKDMNKYSAFKGQSQSGNQHDTLFRNIDGYTNPHLSTESPIFSERNTSGTVSTSQSDRFTVTKFQHGRSSSLGLPNTTDGIHWDRKHNEVPDGPLRPCSRNTSSEGNEQIKRPGDVKLFGQILSHQSSLQNSGSSCNGSKNNPRDHVSCSSRPAVTPHLGLEERSVRSYGHLDGSMAHSEPLLMMAKCQTSLAGVPFYSAKNGTLGVFSDYQQPLMQAHQSDPKRLERYSDPQKRNGMEFISGFQQPGKGSRFGGAGILVSGVSDPVAVLKAQYGPGSKIASCDVDPWKDIGSSSILLLV